MSTYLTIYLSNIQIMSQGDMVAALVKGPEDENWILAEVVSYNPVTTKYDVDDIDEEQKDRHTLSKRYRMGDDYPGGERILSMLIFLTERFKEIPTRVSLAVRTKLKNESVSNPHLVLNILNIQNYIIAYDLNRSLIGT